MLKKDFFNNTGGLNITDSPFYVKDTQASGGQNYDYTKTGSISSRRGLQSINQVADAQLRTLGLGQHQTADGIKTICRVAGTKFQTVNLDSLTFTNQVEDITAVNSDFFNASSEQPVEMFDFLTQVSSVMWAAGAGATSLYGYTGSKITKNGVPAPTGTFTATNLGSSTGTFITTGVYYYALVLRKSSTQARSNAALDKPVTIATTSDTVLLTFPTGVDTTKYDKWLIYRSNVGGVSDFTTGSLVAEVNTTTPTYTDTGTQLASAQNVPRAGGVEDNSELPTGTIKYITIFKRRLIVAIDSTIYFSDLNKSESWPVDNTITIPTGGPITGLGIVGSNAPLSTSTDEYLIAFKEKECWIVTGLSIEDWELKFVAAAGCANQSLICSGSGYVAWMDYRGIYIWNGNGKPLYTSRPLETLFAYDGDLDKPKLYKGWCEFSQKKNQIIWVVSNKVMGENKYSIKLDLRLTLPDVQQGLDSPIMDGVFIVDNYTTALYSALAFLPSSVEEIFLVGDGIGFLHKDYVKGSDNDTPINFQYTSKFLDFESPGQAKRYHKVIVWVDEAGPWDLTLNYWTGYRLRPRDASSIDQTMESVSGDPASLWDLAVWDISLWDDYRPKLKPIVYNLSNSKNNGEGDCLLLQFEQNTVDSPVTINGFSVLYEILPVRKS